MLEIPLWFEIGTYVALLLILATDVFLAYRRPHVPASSSPGGSPNTACRSTTCSSS
jgi:hypothetical protein